jgi:hypothetical protein
MAVKLEQMYQNKFDRSIRVELVFTGDDMCRSIKQLRNSDIPATEDEIRAAALQFIRKVSGYRKPSRLNEAAFERAVEDVAEATHRLLDELKQPHVHSA